MIRLSLLLMLLAARLELDRTVIIHANVPPNTPTVYFTGNLPELGPWEPKKLAMESTGTSRTVTLHVPDGFELEYKFTLGSWDRESLGPSGTILPNLKLKVDGDKEISIDIPDFKKEVSYYLDTWKESGVL